ncbi:MAG: SRPBCC family protein, partial [Sediminibacterium sp.]|nr:SRPBCC family protein [Sediminibacterium sp.]
NYVIRVKGEIDKPKQVIMDYLKQLKKQNEWSVWVMNDPNAQMDYKGIDGTIGFVSAWKSKVKNVGEGKQEITAITDSSIETSLRFIKPFASIAKAHMLVHSINENKCEVTFEFYGQSLHYPLNVLTLLMKNMLTNAQKNNIQNVKKNLEK